MSTEYGGEDFETSVQRHARLIQAGWLPKEDAARLRASNEALAEEVERLKKQCEGLAQSALNNGQDLLLKEASNKALVEANKIGLMALCTALQFVSGLDTETATSISFAIETARAAIAAAKEGR
jgi:hypothetical protein